MTGWDEIPQGSSAVIDSSVLFAMGGPDNEKYQAFQRFVTQHELTILIQRENPVLPAKDERSDTGLLTGGTIGLRVNRLVRDSLLAGGPEIERAPRREHVETDGHLVAFVCHTVGFPGI
jgi:hypothetical protein